MTTPAEKAASKKRRRLPGSGSSAYAKRFNNVACNVRPIRKSLGLSMEDVAIAIETSVSVIHAIEHGSDLRMTTAKKIAVYFGRSMSELWP